MSRYRRTLIPGGTWFFTVVTSQRQPLLTDIKVMTAFRAALQRVKVRYPFYIDAMVVLPDHFHAIWTLPEHDKDYGKRISVLKRDVAQCVRHRLQNVTSRSKQQRRELGLWQRRFWEHQIRDDRDFERHADYIHYNPVKHGYVHKVSDWPHSTFHRYVTQGIYPIDWGGTETAVEGEFGE
jgi:putative transposase